VQRKYGGIFSSLIGKFIAKT